MTYRQIALAKGELGKETEAFMRSLNCPVQIQGKPVLRQRIGGIDYQVMRPKDVARLVGMFGEYGFDYGITGRDLVEEVGNGDARIVGSLPFGLGRISVYGKPDQDTVSLDNLAVVTSEFPNVSKRWMASKGFETEYLLVVDGSDEGYIPQVANLGIGIVSSGETLRRNGLVEKEVLMETSAVIIARDDLGLFDFYRTIIRDENELLKAKRVYAAVMETKGACAEDKQLAKEYYADAVAMFTWSSG